MPSTKIGLALGSGAAWGLAHIGVLEILEREGIPISMITGTSMGAAIGALYAQGNNTRQIKNLALDLVSKRFTFLVDPTLLKTGLLRGRRIENTLKSAFGNIEFGNLNIPFACVATDINSGEEIVINEGLVWEGIRISSSIPALFNVVRREGRYLVDGSLVNPVPVSVLKKMGADFIIAVNVIPEISANDRTRWMGEEKSEEPKEPNIISIIMQSIYIGTHALAKASLEGADVVIQPRVAHIGPTDFRRLEECIQQGVRATQELIPEIIKLGHAATK